MKVLLVVHQFLPRHITGTEQYVRTIARGLRDSGIDAHVFAYEPAMHEHSPRDAVHVQDETVDGVPVYRVGLHQDLWPNAELRDYENPTVGALLGQHLDREDYDLVHAFHLRNIGTGGILEPKVRGLPVVMNLMDFWFICANYLLWRRTGELCDGPPDEGFGCIDCIDPQLAAALDTQGLKAALRQIGDLPTPPTRSSATVVRKAHALVHRKEHLVRVLNQADRLIAPSRFLEGVYRSHDVQAPIQHVPYGIDPGRFVDMPAKKPTPGRPHLDIGYVGSISEHKGVHVLLDAVAQIEGDGIRVHVHGSRNSQPGFSEPLVDGCEDPRVAFHGRFAPTDLGRVLASLDLLVVPSLWYENTPFSVLEALHARVPVIASDLGGISEVVEDGRNGRLFPAGDSAALAAVLREIAAAPAEQLHVTGPGPAPIEDNIAVFAALYAELIRS